MIASPISDETVKHHLPFLLGRFDRAVPLSVPAIGGDRVAGQDRD